MHHLDAVGRYTPDSRDLSRAAAERHAHLAALREGRRRSRRSPHLRWWRRPRLAVPAFRPPHGEHPVGDGAPCA